jgi:hypothetical protein
MNKISYSGYRFPPEIIQQAIWLYLRFTLSLRDLEDLLAERGVEVSYETVRRWVNHFGPMIAADLRKRRLKPHTTWHLDEVYLKIDGRMVYLWRAVENAEVRDGVRHAEPITPPNAPWGMLSFSSAPMAPDHYVVQPRSSRVTRARPRTGHVSSRGGPQLCR